MMDIPSNSVSPTTPLNLLTVTASNQTEIAANQAHLFVSVRASALIGGNTALRKSREVFALVESLLKIGVTQEQIELKSVSAYVTNGIVAKSSARYQIMIRCEDLEKLADILGVLTDQKNCVLDAITWRYPREEDALNEWLVICAKIAKQRAAQIADALSVSLGNLHSFTYTVSSSEPSLQDSYASTRYSTAPSGIRSSGTAIMQPDLDMMHTKTVTVNSTAQYHIG